VEWPQRGEGWLAQADLEIKLEYQPDGRTVILEAHSEKGKLVRDKLINNFNPIQLK
jgi:tRNA threonylcarbamoyladenosine biosynthesis protein TsaE